MTPGTDAVTGALTRGALATCLNGAIAHAQRIGGSCSVFLFDVDHFKAVNDAYGHARGDAVLRQVADRSVQLVRASDILVRYGGDEFVLVLPETGREKAAEVASRLVDGVKNVPFPGSPPLSISISMGMATFPDEADTGSALLQIADRRNYVAKRRGRGRVVADDLEASMVVASGRLLEREIALGLAQDLLNQLHILRHGALRVVGDRGVGHSRFLAEVTILARLRGFEVRTVRAGERRTATERLDRIREAGGLGGGQPLGDRQPAGTSVGLLVVADTDADWVEVSRLVRELTATEPGRMVGLIYAAHDQVSKPSPLPLVGTAVLAPLSASALRVWLRTALRGEPSPALVGWLSERSGGAIARAERELTRLMEAGSLMESPSGSWDVSTTKLSRASRARRRLPAALSVLIGRERDTAVVSDLLADHRLVTLVGPGGIGKTRLSLAVAGAIADEFSDGAAFVPLSEATTTDLVVAAVAEVLDVAEVTGEPIADTVIKQLAGQNLLLVLDNFEQVLVAAPWVAELLSMAGDVRVLATSRERLRLSGEQVYVVPPLPLPDIGQLPPGPEKMAAALAASPALALFVTRAREASYDVEFTAANVRAAAAICHRLDGLPLAIELAAARCDTSTPGEVLDQLTRRFDLLTGGPQDAPLRQQTLRAAIDWSFDLLDQDAQDLMTTLAVFAGGCNAEAAAAVSGPALADTPGAPADRLAALADKNLLRAEETPDGPRYAMLETIRAYANERLARSADAAAVHERYVSYFATFAEDARGAVGGPGEAELLSRISREYSNLRAAFTWCLDQGDALTAGRITLGGYYYWNTGHSIGEGRAWHRRVLATGTSLPGALRSRLLASAGFLAGVQHDLDESQRLGQEALTIASQEGNPHLISAALNVLGIAAEKAGDYTRAAAYHREGLKVAREHGDKRSENVHRGNLTQLALCIDDLDTAYDLARLNLDAERALGNLTGVALTLENLGHIQLRRGDPAGAKPLLIESLEIGRTLGDVLMQAYVLHRLGQLAQVENDPELAYRQIATALKLSHDLGDLEVTTDAMEDIAELVSAADPLWAAQLLGAVETARERHRSPPAQFRRGRAEEILAAIRGNLQDAEIASAWAAGQHKSLESIVEDIATTLPPDAV